MHAFARPGCRARHARAPDRRELVARLERRPGQKEERYAQLLSADVDEAGPGASPGIGARRVPRPRPRPQILRAPTHQSPRRRHRSAWRSASLGWSAKSPRCARPWGSPPSPNPSHPRPVALLMSALHAAHRRRVLDRHRQRRRHPARARRGPRVVPLAVRAAARARATCRPSWGSRPRTCRTRGQDGCSCRACCSSRASRSIFILLGLGATVIGSTLNDHKQTLEQVGGVVIVLMGVVFLATPFVDRLNCPVALRVAACAWPVAAAR